MTDISSPGWVKGLADAASKAQLTTTFPNAAAVVALAVGKKECIFKITDGRLDAVEPDTEAAVRIPLTNAQLTAVLDGSLQLSSAYMRGDIKPVGSTRALLLAIEVFDHPEMQKQCLSLLE